MFTYTIIVDSRSYDLIPYTEKLEIRIQSEQTKLRVDGPIGDKRKLQKNFIKDTLCDKEFAESIINGDADPNVVNYVYCSIIEAYLSPASAYQNETNKRKLDDSGMSEVTEFLKAVNGAERALQNLTK